ncbi:hypothetical protein TWF694_001319 [Orbilia ellipsospora]|uniref:Kelch repeat protein n=1 Tax=Orbilia ellipsospora TaxID=2528407 RepID=A0AAV9XR80_9PEZI
MPTLHGEEKALASRASTDLCAVINQASAIVGGQLYYAMGTYTFSDGNLQVRQNKLFTIPLTKSFPAHSLISSSTYSSVDIPAGVPINDDEGVFLYTNTTLYFYEPDQDRTNGTSIWTFNASNETFTQVTVGGGENVPYQLYPGGFASDPATGRMYYSGSLRNSQKRKVKRTLGDVEGEGYGVVRRAPSVPWVQILDASGGDFNASWVGGAGGGPTLLYGTLQYVRYGKKGILVGFGGVDPEDHSQFADQNVASYRSMTEIFIFDIDSQTWYSIEATGATGEDDIPTPRLSFCSTVSAAPDDSSFQITIYGGFWLSAAAATNKVHVLILPTFQWLDVTPKDQTLGDGNYGRQSHRCALWNDAQMIVLGGIIQGINSRNNTPVNTGTCNSTHPPLLVLDTTTFEWVDTFNPNKSYSQPKQIYDVIGGDWRGLNGRTSPNGGFNNSQLTFIFENKVRRIDQPTAFAASSPGPTSTSGPGGGSNGGGNGGGSKSNTGAIAGGVVAGVVVVALVAGIIWWFLRKRRTQEPPSIPQPEGVVVGGGVGGAPTGMNRFEKPELDGTVAGARPNQTAFDPQKVNGTDANGAVMELHGDLVGRPVDGNNHNLVYELESSQPRGELGSEAPRGELDSAQAVPLLHQPPRGV